MVTQKKIIIHENNKYLEFQSKGNASQFAIPFAKHLCIGKGYDIGYCKEAWKFPDAIGIDLKNDSNYHAMNLPDVQVDYIYSSHCLEHLESWIEAIEYWTTKIKKNGVLFLYLPHYSQTYWRPWNNKKHRHIIESIHVKDLLIHLKYKEIFISGVDLNNSFMAVGYK